MSSGGPAAHALEAVYEEGSRAHYRDAAYYDHTYKRRRDDVAFYEGLVGPGEAVLELGAGTGRVSLALAAKGAHVVAVDPAPEMRARLKEKLCGVDLPGRIEVRDGDLRTLRLKRRFRWVLAPFNVLQHIYTHRALGQAARTVLHHLDSDGEFVFDVSMPDPYLLSRDPARFYKARPFTDPTTKTRHGYAEAFDYDAVRQVLHVYMRHWPLDDESAATDTLLSHRQWYPAELQSALESSGLRVNTRLGDWEGNALSGRSDVQVLRCSAMPP